MNYLLFSIIFIVVLFLYTHVYFHLKTSNDLEIYEIDTPSKSKFEEICDLRQPVLFRVPESELLNSCTFSYLYKEYDAFDINIRNKENNEETSELYIPLTLHEGIKLFENDEKESYFTEHNEDFLKETGYVKTMKMNDNYLRPPMVSKCMYDITMGSLNVTTPLRYYLNYRNYLFVTCGSIHVKLIAPYWSKYLYTENDYTNYEFRSPLNIWNIQDKYKKEFDKIKVLEVTLHKGDALYIPPYWWNTIQYNNDANVAIFKYRTYMNTVSIIPNLFISFLQQSNIKREITNTVKQKID